MESELGRAADSLPAGDSDRLDETMGLDSAATISLMVAIENEFGIVVEETDDMESFRTVERIVELVESKRRRQDGGSEQYS